MKEKAEKSIANPTTPNSNLPIDRGWAWVILFASFAEAFFLIGTHASFGIFFVVFMEKFNATASSITIALSVQTTTLSLCSAFLESLLLNGLRRSFGIFFVAYMTKFQAPATSITYALSVDTASLSILSLLILSAGSGLCSNRVYVMLAGLTGCCSYMLNAFAPNVSFLILSQGFLYGLTHALAHGSTLVVLGRYFEKKRGLATLLANVGASVGSLAFPPFIQYLLDEFGLQGTLIIVSGLLLNFIVAGSLMRPLSFYERKRKWEDTSKSAYKVEKPKNREIQSLLENEPKSVHLHNNGNNHLHPDITSENSTKPLITRHELAYELTVPDPIVRDRAYSSGKAERPSREKDRNMFGSARSLNISKNEKNFDSLNLAASTGDFVGSLYSLHSNDFRMHSHTKENADTAEATDDKVCCKHLSSDSIKTVLTNLIDCNVLKNRLFLMFIPAAFCAIVGAAQMLTYIPPHASDLGVSKTNTALLITIAGATDLGSKFFLSFLADCNVVKKHQMLAVALILVGIITNLVPFYTDFNTLIILVVGYGLFGGLYFGLFPAVLVDFVGLRYLSAALGFTLLVHGIALSITAPILGFIRDTTGSFMGSFHLMGSSLLLAGLILLTEPIFRRLEEKRVKANESSKTDL